MDSQEERPEIFPTVNGPGGDDKPGLGTLFLTAAQYADIPTLDASENPLDIQGPYKYLSPCGSFMVGIKVNGDITPIKLERIASTPKARIAQLRRAGRTCNACHEHLPTCEVGCVTEKPDTGEKVSAVIYLCSDCNEKARGNAQKNESMDVSVNRLQSDLPRVKVAPGARGGATGRKARRASKKKSGSGNHRKQLTRKQIKAKRKRGRR